MSDVLRGDLQTTAERIDCYGHWEGPVAEWRAHLITGHCQVDRCDQLAHSTIELHAPTSIAGVYGGTLVLGAPLGICAMHLGIVRLDVIGCRLSRLGS